MNTKVSDHIESNLNDVRKVFVAASKVIENLKVGEKIAATKLAADLAPQFNTTGPNLYPVLKYLLPNYPGVIVKRGAKGGIERVSVSEENE